MTVIYVIVALVTGFSLFDYYVNRNWEAITSVSRNEAVFAHRNRAYGAYALRSGYNKRMTLILGGLVGFAALIFVVTFIIKNLPKEEIKKPKVSEKKLHYCTANRRSSTTASNHASTTPNDRNTSIYCTGS